MKPQPAMNQRSTQKPPSRLKAWAAFMLCVALTWAFIFYIGPWIRDHIPVMKQLTEVVKERDIDTTTFFYSETKESYEGERYLRDTLDLTRPKGYGFNLFFFIGVGVCFAILAIGFRLMSIEGKGSREHKTSNRKT